LLLTSSLPRHRATTTPTTRANSDDSSFFFPLSAAYYCEKKPTADSDIAAAGRRLSINTTISLL